MEQLGDLMNLVDDIKEKIDDAQYKELVDTLKSINDNRDYPDLYLVKYWQQSTKITQRNDDVPTHNKFVLEKKNIVAKFCRRTFESEEVIDEYIKNFDNKGDLYIRTNWGFPLIQTLQAPNAVYIATKLDDRDRDDGDDEELVQFMESIPISIKKI
jgi:hypothetical protein